MIVTVIARFVELAQPAQPSDQNATRTPDRQNSIILAERREYVNGIADLQLAMWEITRAIKSEIAIEKECNPASTALIGLETKVTRLAEYTEQFITANTAYTEHVRKYGDDLY